MRVFLLALAWICGLPAVLVAPWFTGAIYRHEQAMWVMTQYASSLDRFGPSDARLTLVLYAIYYLSFFLIPFAALSTFCSFFPKQAGVLHLYVPRMLVALWFATAIAIWWHPVFEFIRAVPDTWNGWLVILWIGASFLLVFRLGRFETASEESKRAA